jgi:hypothetical protein
MRADFQDEILRFILQTKEGKKYAAHLEKELWDDPLKQTVFELYAGYVKQFNGVPSKVTLMEFFDRELKKKKGEKISAEVYREFERQVYKMYEPFEEDAGLIRKSIREFAQRKMLKLTIRENVDKIKDGDDEYINSLVKQFVSIGQLKDKLDEEPQDNRSGRLIAGFEGIKKSAHIQVWPTFLTALNDMTSDGGFFAPQLVLLMGGPKAIKRRFYQAMLHVTKHDMQDPAQEVVLARMVKKFMGRNGDIEVGMFASKTLDDVDAELEYLRDEYNWTPQIIIYDYLKKFKSTNPKITDARLIIQDVFNDAKRLNVKWKTLAISVAKVKQQAVEKEVIKQTDIGDDFEQIYNCDAAFALCRTPEEMEAGIARIIPVAQREGEAYTGSQVCMIKIEPDRMKIEETTVKQITKTIKEKKGLKDE